MTNQNPLSQAQLDLLLKMAGKQLHIDPNALKQQLERGDLSSISARPVSYTHLDVYKRQARKSSGVWRSIW